MCVCTCRESVRLNREIDCLCRTRRGRRCRGARASPAARPRPSSGWSSGRPPTTPPAASSPPTTPPRPTTPAVSRRWPTAAATARRTARSTARTSQSRSRSDESTCSRTSLLLPGCSLQPALCEHSRSAPINWRIRTTGRCVCVVRAHRPYPGAAARAIVTCCTATSVRVCVSRSYLYVFRFRKKKYVRVCMSGSYLYVLRFRRKKKNNIYVRPCLYVWIISDLGLVRLYRICGSERFLAGLLL
jgi:hypothetical protein